MPLQALGQRILLANPAGGTVLGPIAALNDGTLVLAGSYRNESGGHLTRYSADGQLLTSIDVTIQGVAETYYADVKALTGGGFVLIYTNQDTYSPDEMYARSFSANGTPLGATVHIGDGDGNPNSSQQNEGFITPTRDGGWFVEYTDDSQNGTNYYPLVDYPGTITYGNSAMELWDVLGAFAPVTGGAPGASRNLVAGQETAPGPRGGHYEGAALEQRSGQPTALSTGAVVTPYIDTNVYTFNQNDGSSNAANELGISFRIVTPGGATAEIRANQTYLAGGSHPEVDHGVRPVAATLSGGGFVLVWADASPRNDGYTDSYYVAKTFDDAGNPTSSEQELAVPFGFSPGGAVVAGLQTGGFALAYTDLGNGGDGHDVHLAAFNAQAQLLSDVVVGGGPGQQDLRGLTAAPDGSVDVTWYDANATGSQLYLQRYVLADASQQVLTGDDQANSLTGAAGADWFDGEGGNDTIFGQGGNDRIYGGAGTDTAVYSATLAGSVIARTSLTSGTISSAADGADTFSGIEILKFANGQVQLSDGRERVDDVFYVGQRPDIYNAGIDPDAHYDAYGWHEGVDPNAFFSTKGYLAANADIKNAGLNPLEHYHLYGWQEGRDASASFDTRLYLQHNPDVAALNIDPLEQYLAYGRFEGRQAYAAIGDVITNTGFDAEYYLLKNPDVAAAGLDPYQHYLQYGWKEGRNPNAWFDDAGYLNAYGDIKAAGLNPLLHYMQYGWHENRDPSANFDTSNYLAANPDVASAGLNPLLHYLKYGAYENRGTGGDGVFDH